MVVIMANESFIFYQSFCDTTEQLSDEDYGKLMRAVHQYGIHGIEPDSLSPMLMMAFGLMKPQIDANNRRRKNGKLNGEKGSEYGKLGGRPPKKSTSQGLFEKPPGGYDENPQGVSEKPPNVNENGNVNGNLNENDKEKENEAGSYFSESGFQDDPGISPDAEPPSGSKPVDSPEKNYALIFEQVKSKWKEVTGQETRETLFTVSPPKRERFINALGIYSLEDIFNAIGNYHIARSDPETFDVGGRIYGNLIGFLENGVSQFFKDEAVEFNFRRQKHGGQSKK
jgi:hypothetical protein